MKFKRSFPCGQVASMVGSRRDFLSRAGLGIGSIALAQMLQATSATSLASESNPLAAKIPHFAPRAKRIIFLFMEGGPSQCDLIDYKPALIKHHDEPIPFEMTPKRIREGKGEKFENFGSLMGPLAKFQQRGDSGLWMSDLIPHMASHADDLCILNGMNSDSTEHGTAISQLHTGQLVLPRPSMGAWLLYGLGTENQDMPGFVVVSQPTGTAINCGTAFLPSIYQATTLHDTEKAKGDRIRYLNDGRLPRDVRRKELAFLQSLNRDHLARAGEDKQLDAMIESFELAFRMQQTAPEILDIDRESDATHKLYGLGEKDTDGFGRQCLMARRLAEAGVRCIQVTSKGWDHHNEIKSGLEQSCLKVDKPIAGLLTDLKQRGLLDDTLVVWTGEFGRTPVSQDVGKVDNRPNRKPPGRGHNPFGWSLWMAGGGLKRGIVHGATDDFGYSSVEGRVHIHDLHATILHLLGMDHEKLSYRFGGRDFRLTDVYGDVVHAIIA
jgi:hypothetical protein